MQALGRGGKSIPGGALGKRSTLAGVRRRARAWSDQTMERASAPSPAKTSFAGARGSRLAIDAGRAGETVPRAKATRALTHILHLGSASRMPEAPLAARQ